MSHRPSEILRRRRPRGAARHLRIVLGDQLQHDSRLIAEADADLDIVLMMEVREESLHVPSHAQRITLFLSAMRHYAVWLIDQGFRVCYITLDESDNTQMLSSEVERAVKRYKPERIIIVEPGEYRVQGMIDEWPQRLNVDVDVLPDEHYLTSREEFDEWANGRKQLVMEHFYRHQRKRLGVLMNSDGKPTGGRWNFDQDNRQSFKASPRPQSPKSFTPDDVTREVMALVNEHFPDAPGDLGSFSWPVTREGALEAMDDFINHRLHRFGPYQDAMWTDQPFLYHSLLSPMLNLKLLDPREVVTLAIAAAEDKTIPVSSLEGFIRQIIGWREFIRGVYWHQGPAYAERNRLHAMGALPELYWTGQTDMNCMKQAVGQVLQFGYGHHIQRLMVTGNFALIAGVHPRAVSDWYLAMYVDAVDWVTLPNTLGMVMHADDGVVGTKPYAASGKYIERMSNYCDACPYDPSRRAGSGACPFTVFYWDFLIRHEQRFRSNHRMTMMMKHVQRIAKQERVEITVSAKSLRDSLGISDL